MINSTERLHQKNLILENTHRRFLFFEQEWHQFSRWWLENQTQFSHLSFNIESQRNQFIGDINSGEDFDEAFNKVRADLWGYYLEYIRQEAIIPFTNRIKNSRLVGDFYGDKPIVDLTEEKEREGATKEAMIDLEEKLLNSPIGTVILRVSPKGWTNMGYDYTETQWQILYKEKEDLIRGLTIRTQADLEPIINFLRDQFNIDFSNLTERDKLKAVTSLNIPFQLDQQIDRFFPLIELISTISQKDHRGNNLLVSYQNWQQSDGDFQRYDRLTDLLDFLEEKLKRKLTNEEIDSLLAFALIQMGIKEMFEKELQFTSIQTQSIIDTDVYLPPLPDYQRILRYLQTLPGCAGGGTPVSLGKNLYQGPFYSFILNSFGSVEISSSHQAKEKLSCVNCPFCHQIVDAEIYDGKIHCPKCGAEADIENNF